MTMTTSASHNAAELVSVIQLMGQSHSNPVLDVLDGEAPVNNHKYPQDELHFDDTGWRAFYHCHDAPNRDQQEHGHFHLFRRCGPGQDVQKDWCHIIALAMDYEGQPLAWFSTNQWVTGGAWIKAPAMERLLEPSLRSSNLNRLERWLMNMVALFHEDIVTLLHDRDRALEQHQEQLQGKEILQDRNIYCLSSAPISFTETLQAALVAENMPKGD